MNISKFATHRVGRTIRVSLLQPLKVGLMGGLNSPCETSSVAGKNCMRLVEILGFVKYCSIFNGVTGEI